MDVKDIAKVAIDEVLNPTFELTKQYLASNQLVFQDAIPVIEDIIIDMQEKKAEVYFPIVDENFYFVVIVAFEKEICPFFMNMSPGNRVELFVSSEDYNLFEIMKRIDIEPTRKWEKGEKHGKKVEYKHSGFIYRLSEKLTGDIENKLKLLVNELLPRREMLLKLSEIADVEIQVTYYGYKDEMWGINLNRELINDLAKLNLPLDIDLYAGGNDLVHKL